MTTTNHRETAVFECPSCKVHPHRQACTLNCEDARVADAYARGRAEAKAEDAARIEKSIDRLRESEDKAAKRGDKVTENFCDGAIFILAEELDAILADSSSTYEERLRAEIAENVKAIPTFNGGRLAERGAMAFRDDVLAIIEGGGKPNAKD